MFNSRCALSYFLSGISNVAFFFNAICTQEKKKGSIQESKDESDNSNEEFESSQVPTMGDKSVETLGNKIDFRASWTHFPPSPQDNVDF